MKRLFLAGALLGVVACAHAAIPTIDPVFRPEPKPLGPAYEDPVERASGDTIEDPLVIGSLPFTDSGTTCGFSHDYDAVCPYADATAPDVVYRYDCAAGEMVTIDLCASSYDTKVYVFEDGADRLIACNDDWCAYQSLLTQVPLAAGCTYYIVVDGFGASCGEYVLEVSRYTECTVECPPGALPEGEIDCYDGYKDIYNSGCACLPDGCFQLLEPSCDPIVLCGTTGVYQTGPMLYRDTDWFEIRLSAPALVCLAGDAEIPMHFVIIDGRDGCQGLSFAVFAEVGPCAQVSDICHDCEPGTWWLWAGPVAWDLGFACGSRYRLEVGGYAGGPSPAQRTTWGAIKSLMR